MSSSSTPIAVVGVSSIFPGGTTTAEFWRDIVDGADRITDVPRTHWLREDYFDPTPGTPDKVYTTRGGFLGPVEFSPLEFGLTPTALPATDTAQLLALVVAKRALTEATRGLYESMDRSRMSVILGVASATELVGQMAGRLQIPLAVRALRAAGLGDDEVGRVKAVLESSYVPWQESTFPGLLGNVVAGRIANRLDLRGTNAVVDAACASSLAAIDMAVGELSLGRSDLVVTGGVDTLNDIFMFMCFAQTGALSRTGECRPFAVDADGTLLGEGIGMLVLKRLADAERDGDGIYAVIRGIGSSSDGRGKSIYAPVADGQAIALRRAYENAGYRADTVGLVEAHGTATQAGDAAELEGLSTVWAEANAAPESCALGSVKSQIGHTKAAAGAAGLIKAVLALHHRVLPPTQKVTRPNLRIADTPFYVNSAPRPWVKGAHPRRASVSALGFGGTNFHVAVEEYAGTSARPERLRAVPSELVLLGADDERGLVAACLRAADECGAAGSLPHVAKGSQLAFSAASRARLAIVATSESDLADKLRAATDAIDRGQDGAKRLPAGHPLVARSIHFGGGPVGGSVAFLFPGQGSQYVGMGLDLAVHFDAVRDLWDQVSAGEAAGQRLCDRVFPISRFSAQAREADDAALIATEWAQPAITATSLSMLRLLKAARVVPTFAAGHSLGEITALAAAGVLDGRVAIAIARRRGELMALASERGSGTMTAVMSDRATVEKLLSAWKLPVTVANDNAPQQVVLSGSSEAIEALERRLRDERIATHRLNVSAAFHSPLVASAVAPFRAFLDSVEVSSAKIPVFANATAREHPREPASLRDALADSLVQPVRFREQVEAMYERGARVFVEVGPDSVLTKLATRSLAHEGVVAVAVDQRGQHGVTSLWDALGQLAVAGVDMDFRSLWDREKLPDDPAARVAPKLAVELLGSNYGKPPPPPPAPARPPLDKLVASAPIRGVSEAIHAPLIAAQREYQRLMTESHIAFLQAASGYTRQAIAESMPLAPADLSFVAPMPAPVRSPPPATPAASAPRPTARPAVATPDLVPLVLAVVAEKTGYPSEMIDLSMDLEADLGIDSIKRVEILAAVRERAPGLPELDAGRLAKLRTLAAIVAFLSGSLADSPSPLDPAAPRRDSKAANGEVRSGTVTALERRVVRAEAAPALGFALPGLFRAGTLLVVDEGSALAREVVTRLVARQLSAVAATAATREASAVVFLGGMAKGISRADAFRINRDAFHTARVIAPRLGAQGGAFVTVQDTGGDFGLSGLAGDRAWLGGIGALAKTAAREWPLASVRAIDLERGDRSDADLADALVAELLGGAPELEVGLSANGTRVSIGSATSHLSGGPLVQSKRGDVFLATGGARGVTAASLVELAALTKPRLLLLGRTPLSPEATIYSGVTDDAALKRLAFDEATRTGEPTTPRAVAGRVDEIVAGRQVRQTLRQIAAAGAEARYAVVDSRDRAALDLALTDVRRTWGPVRGLIHGAGVVADALIENKTDEQFDRVFDTKVRGLEALLDATARDPIAWICLFSSVAARTGNAGQADYAMANEILNKVAAAEARRRGPTCRVVSIGWGPWQGGMVGPSLAKQFASQGVSLVPVAAGARAFVDELASTSGVEVVLSAKGSPPPSAAVVADVFVDHRTYPELTSHRVHGNVVLPAVLPVEWFVRLATRALGMSSSAGLAVTDLRVLRGIVLSGYAGPGNWFHVVGQPSADGLRVSFELHDEAGAKRYTATVERSRGEQRASRLGGGDAGDAWIPAELYGPRGLFHGPGFQAIRGAEGTASGARAHLIGRRELGWLGASWVTDPAAMDGAIQLAFLVGLHHGLGPSLPLRIGRIGFGTPSDGPLMCDALVRDRSNERLICDLALYAADSTAVASIDGLELYALPGVA